MNAAEHLKEAFWNLKARRIRVSTAHTTRASEIGSECERYLVYSRTQGNMRLPHQPSLQAIFDLGNHLENYVVRELEEMGCQIYQRGRDYEDRRLEMTGHVDVKIQIPGVADRLPTEIKGLNPFTADSIRTADDIRNHKHAHVRRYFAQLQVYLLLDNSEHGLFALLNKVTGVIEFINVSLDYEYAEALLKKAERIRDHVRAGSLPDRHVTEECHRCPFAHVCQPDLQYGEGVSFWDSADVELMLQRRAELEPAAKEFKSLDEAIKRQAPQKPELLCGDFVLKGKEVERAGYAVAPTKFWQWSIRRIGKVKDNGSGTKAA